MARDQSKNLGRTQVLVMQLLTSGDKSAQTLASDWPGLTESSARSALNRLGDRGLVDVRGWDDYQCRTYGLTAKGRDVELALLNDDDQETMPNGD